MDAERDEDEAYGCVEAGRIILAREDVQGPALHLCRPRHPGWFRFWVGADVKAKDDQDGGEEPSGPFAGVAPALVGGVLRYVGEEDAEEGERSKRCCLGVSIKRTGVD